MAYLPFLKERSPHHQAFSPTQFVSNRLGIPDHRFNVGDRIKHSYICDDEIDLERHGQLITTYGLILWMMPDVQLGRWQYFVLFDDDQLKSFDCDLPYLDNEIEFA